MAGTSEPFMIAAGRFWLELVPELGGSVARFVYDGTDLMRPLSAIDRRAGNVLGVAMFPMVPYANRIEGNAFSFGGRLQRVAANNPPERYNVHGSGWRERWQTVDASPSSATLQLSVVGGGETFAYDATQRFDLDPDGLTVTMTLTNQGDVDMPFGFGWHPWFERDDETTVQFAADRFYLEEPDGVAGDWIPLPDALSFAAARPLPRRWRNNDYGGWNGIASLSLAHGTLTLNIAADTILKHLMLYAVPSRTVFCLEPQTNASGAFNREGGFADPAEGTITLGPGGTVSGAVRFSVTA